MEIPDNRNEFETLMAQIIAKLDEGPGSHTEALEALVQRHVAVKELGPVVADLNESIQALRLIARYMMFDLEATRRERDQLRTMLEDQE